MKALIIEDEDLVAAELKAKIRSVADDIDIIDILPSIKTAKRWFMQNAEPDLIFMDIQLNDGVSFEIFETYKISCPVIFTTAYDEYAIRAFKVNSIDYLLKPVNEAELGTAIEKSRQRMRSTPLLAQDINGLLQSLGQISNARPSYKEKFVVNIRNQFLPVNTKDIACFVKEALNYIYLFNGEKYVIDFTSLEEIEELLDPRQFYRANRQFIINIDAIRSARPKENSKLTIYLKEPLHKFDIDMSREKAPAFKKWLDR
jgi:DNA-binding LytR/AlgR family response regulator